MSRSRSSLTVGSLIGVPVWTPLGDTRATPFGADFGDKKRKKKDAVPSRSTDPSALRAAMENAPTSPDTASPAQPRALMRAPSRSCCRMGCAGCPFADAQRRAGGLLPILGR